MFDKRFAWTAAAVVLVATLSFVLSQTPDKPEIAPITESVAGIKLPDKSSPESSSSEASDYAYLIKEHEGRVAVFPAGKNEPELILDVLVKHLPDYDRLQMKEGIHVKDFDELVSLLEDYGS